MTTLTPSSPRVTNGFKFAGFHNNTILVLGDKESWSSWPRQTGGERVTHDTAEMMQHSWRQLMVMISWWWWSAEDDDQLKMMISWWGWSPCPSPPSWPCRWSWCWPARSCAAATGPGCCSRSGCSGTSAGSAVDPRPAMQQHLETTTTTAVRAGGVQQFNNYGAVWWWPQESLPLPPAPLLRYWASGDKWTVSRSSNMDRGIYCHQSGGYIVIKISWQGEIMHCYPNLVPPAWLLTTQDDVFTVTVKWITGEYIPVPHAPHWGGDVTRLLLSDYSLGWDQFLDCHIVTQHPASSSSHLQRGKLFIGLISVEYNRASASVCDETRRGDDGPPSSWRNKIFFRS